MTTVTDLREVSIGVGSDEKALIDLNEVASIIKEQGHSCEVVLKGGGRITGIEEDYDRLVGWWRNTIAAQSTRGLS